jgi:hypothetical protein
MLARAPGDVTRCECRTSKTFPTARTFTPSSLGQRGSVPSYARSERAGRTSERARRTAQISQRRAAGMRCAAGQLTERRADCAADPAHIWLRQSASMVDLSARTRPVRRASRSQISQRSRKDRPRHGVDVVRIGPWPPPAVPSAIAVRPGAPQGPVCGAGDAKRDRSRGGRGRGRGWSLAGSPRVEPCRAGALSDTSVGRGRLGFAPSAGRTTLRPRSVSLFQESPGCPPGSGEPVAGPPGSSSAPGSTPNSSGDAPCHCPGQQGTVRRGSGWASCAREPGANAAHGRSQPAASRWMPVRASLGTP